MTDNERTAIQAIERELQARANISATIPTAAHRLRSNALADAAERLRVFLYGSPMLDVAETRS